MASLTITCNETDPAPYPRERLRSGKPDWVEGPTIMNFVIAIEPGTGSTAWGVAVPDLPGCFSAGDTMHEAMVNARHAIDQHVGILIEDGVAIPAGRPLAVRQADPDYAGWVWAIVDVPVEKYLGPTEKINITVPRLILARIDEYAKSRGMSRSGFLVEAARSAINA